MDQKHIVNTDAKYNATLTAIASAHLPLQLENYWRFECLRADGSLRWLLEMPNLITTAGKNDLLTQYFKGSAYTATWYLGLVDNASFSAYAAGDTSASHAGWLESTVYSNANRPTLTLGTASAGSIDNTGSVAAFNVNGSATIRGAFIITNNTKGGSTGTIYGEADFGASRAVLSGDTLNVTVTLTAS